MVVVVAFPLERVMTSLFLSLLSSHGTRESNVVIRHSEQVLHIARCAAFPKSVLSRPDIELCFIVYQTKRQKKERNTVRKVVCV